MPSLTWRPNEQFEWTLMANVQKDDSGTTSSFLPHRGTVLSAPYGEIGSERFVSEPGFDEYDTEQKALTRSEEHTSELQSLMRISYTVFCLKKKKHNNNHKTTKK